MLSLATALPHRDPMAMDEEAEEDDEPLATDGHYREQIYVYSVLYDRFAGPECYVAFQRWLRRDRERRLSSLQPDLLVALGVPNALRRVYNPWELGKPPTLVAEWLSDSSLKADRELKAGEYRKLGIAEYWLFNPYGEYRDPRVQGWDLQADEDPAPFPVEPDGSVASRVLPVRFVVQRTRLDVLEPTTGAPLTPLRAQELHILDEIARREQAIAARQREAELRRDAEREVQREAAARRREAQLRQQAEQARLQAEQAAQQAEQAAQRDAEGRQRAEEELARLRAELEQLRRERDADA